MMTKPGLIEETDLSCAWARAFMEASKPGVNEISPLIVTIRGFDAQPPELSRIRQVLDTALIDEGAPSCASVANTIFPISMWQPERGRAQLFARYLRILPRLLRSERRNQYGLYFGRLIAFGKAQINQLEHIISTYQGGNHRRSALQASIFDPAADHTNQRRRGFPCLQLVSFIPLDNGELAVNGTYTTQHLYQKAYGNYLGLCNLGRFVAYEWGLRLTQITCITSIATLGKSKSAVKTLRRQIGDILEAVDGDREVHAQEHSYVDKGEVVGV